MNIHVKQQVYTKPWKKVTVHLFIQRAWYSPRHECVRTTGWGHLQAEPTKALHGNTTICISQFGVIKAIQAPSISSLKVLCQAIPNNKHLNWQGTLSPKSITDHFYNKCFIYQYIPVDTSSFLSPYSLVQVNPLCCYYSSPGPNNFTTCLWTISSLFYTSQSIHYSLNNLYNTLHCIKICSNYFSSFYNMNLNHCWIISAWLLKITKGCSPSL